MLCDLAIRMAEDGGLELRVSGRTALGPSASGGRDTKYYPTPYELLGELAAFGVGDEVTAAVASELPHLRTRFLKVAEDVHISFERLATADIHLFDSDFTR